MNKYKEALNELSYPLDDSSCGGCKCGTSDCQDCKKAQAVFTLEQLINEHFDNPPLKFEELEVGMWVWDNKRKEYFKISEIRQKWRYFFFEYVAGFTDFEENRFYRYQVKENEDD